MVGPLQLHQQTHAEMWRLAGMVGKNAGKTSMREMNDLLNSRDKLEYGHSRQTINIVTCGSTGIQCNIAVASERTSTGHAPTATVALCNRT
jgi:hypothetical protein